MNELFKNCHLCPRDCGVNRYEKMGFCKAGAEVNIAKVSLHPWEEPCLIGEKGAGTIFFSHCNLRCVFCQNHEISAGGKGKAVSISRLAEIFIEQQARGAAVIDLVTPAHYAPQIAEALKIAKGQGLAIPVAYNTNAYEKIETIELFRGLVDIFLPDLKYRQEKSAKDYSLAPNYFTVATSAIKKMYDLVGKFKINADGLMEKGVIVRHLVLPGMRHESMEIVRYLHEEYGDDIYLSLMNQYTPMYKAKEMPPLNRRLTTFEYESVVDFASSLGMKNVYVQERRAASEEYVPDFDFSGVDKED